MASPADRPSGSSLVGAGFRTAGLAWGPALVFLAHDPVATVGGVADVGLVVLVVLGLARWRPALGQSRWLRGGLVVLWSVLLVFGVAWAASLVATSEQLPIYDLLLLVRPVWVFCADLYGPLAPWGISLGVFVVLGLAVGLAGLAWWRLPDPPTDRVTAAVAVLSVLLGLVTTGLWTPRVIADIAESARLAARIESAGSLRRDLDARILATRPDVRLYVIESYGDIALEGATGEAHRALLDRLRQRLEAGGWSLASGRVTAPTHGGRSWLADATVLTGLRIDRQSTFGHITARGTTIPSLPRFFADRGYRTILVRPKDRQRPGVRLVNHFGFQTTIFHDELAYRGPAVGWGHIPDQFTVEVTEQDVIAAIEEPVFAFFHLATAHYPWGERPDLFVDARSWQTAEGQRERLHRDRRPRFALDMQLRRFRNRRRALRDRHGADRDAFQALIAYDLDVLAKAFPSPNRPVLMVWFGDHQPPFLADGAPPDAVAHVLASDPSWLDPFLADGFVPGMDPGPRGETTLRHQDLFDRITAALGTPGRPGGPPAE